ncbi:hypothetical protein KI387_020661, partial [Taxus chinensis]
MEREVKSTIKKLVEQEVERNANEVMKEIDEESIGKEYGSMGGDTNLATSFPKVAHI